MTNTEKMLTAAAVALALFIGVVFAASHLMTDRVADRVIRKLQKEYSPSQYGPGFDPDKVPPFQVKPLNGNPPIKVQ